MRGKAKPVSPFTPALFPRWGEREKTAEGILRCTGSSMTSGRRTGSRSARRLSRYGKGGVGRSATHRHNCRSSAFSTRSAGCNSSSIRPYGSRINRAWGLALRKRFAASSIRTPGSRHRGNIVLSLTTAQSFDLAEVQRYLHSASARQVLTEALLDSPMFTTRWRWVAGVALSLPRVSRRQEGAAGDWRGERRGSVGGDFPDQIACAENLRRRARDPDHPLVRQTIDRLPHRGDGCCRARTCCSSGLSAAATAASRAIWSSHRWLALEVFGGAAYATDDAPLRSAAPRSHGAPLAWRKKRRTGRSDAAAIEAVCQVGLGPIRSMPMDLP